MATPLTAAISGLSRSNRPTSPPKPAEIRRQQPCAAAAGRRDLQVVAGGKSAVAGARHDSDPLFRVGGEGVEHRAQFVMGRGMQRVHHLGTVQGDDGQPSLALHFAEFIVGHRRFLMFSGPILRRRAARSKAWVTI
ncbi:MAG: hypothetical protein WDN03_13830 [Rhizomicrobium sp.]